MKQLCKNISIKLSLFFIVLFALVGCDTQLTQEQKTAKKDFDSKMTMAKNQLTSSCETSTQAKLEKVIKDLGITTPAKTNDIQSTCNNLVENLKIENVKNFFEINFDKILQTLNLDKFLPAGLKKATVMSIVDFKKICVDSTDPTKLANIYTALRAEKSLPAEKDTHKMCANLEQKLNLVEFNAMMQSIGKDGASLPMLGVLNQLFGSTFLSKYKKDPSIEAGIVSKELENLFVSSKEYINSELEKICSLIPATDFANLINSIDKKVNENSTRSNPFYATNSNQNQANDSCKSYINGNWSAQTLEYVINDFINSNNTIFKSMFDDLIKKHFASNSANAKDMKDWFKSLFNTCTADSTDFNKLKNFYTALKNSKNLPVTSEKTTMCTNLKQNLSYKEYFALIASSKAGL